MTTSSSSPYDPRDGGREKKKPKRYPPYNVDRDYTPQGTLLLTPRKKGERPLTPKPKTKKKRRKRRKRLLSLTKSRPSQPRYRQITADIHVPLKVGTETVSFANGTVLYSADHVRDPSFVSDRRFAVKKCWDQLNPRVRQNRWAAARGTQYVRGGPLRLVDVTNPWFQIQGESQGQVHAKRVLGSGPFAVVFEYKGGFVPLAMGPDEIHSGNLANAGLDGYSVYDGAYCSAESFGAEAWNKYKPRLSDANVAVGLYELQDLPGMLMTTGKGLRDLYRSMGGKTSITGQMKPGPVADHFLNHVFGWVPFLKDVGSTIDTAKHKDRRLAQIKRDNGRTIRRGGPVFQSDEIINLDHHENDAAPMVWPPINGNMLRFPYPANQAKWGATTTYARVIDSVWFKGAFRYYWPELDPLLEKHKSVAMQNLDSLRVQMHLFGATISPVHIWQATPWTWLYDWFTNVGKVLDNINSMLTENLYAKYAYVMRTRDLTVANDSVIHLWDDTAPVDVFCHWEQKLLTKDRTEANPFGFSLSHSDLSVKQLAILAALGITRVIR